jgi:outer membrane murein-binding lipoprotein Lpp
MRPSQSFQSQTRAMGAAVASALIGFAGASRADELSELKAQVDALNRKVADLERETTDGSSGNLNRVQASAQYFF